MKKSRARTKSYPAQGAWPWQPVGKGPETPPAESALRKVPVCKEPPPQEREDLVTRTKPGEVNLEFGFSTGTWSEPDTVPTCQKAKTSSARSTTPGERYYVKYHRPRNRPRALRRSASVIGGTGRRSATSAPLGHQSREAELELRDYDPSLKDSAAEHWRFLEECCKTHRPDANDRERCKEERQCGGVTNRRKERRESRYC